MANSRANCRPSQRALSYGWNSANTLPLRGVTNLIKTVDNHQLTQPAKIISLKGNPAVGTKLCLDDCSRLRVAEFHQQLEAALLMPFTSSHRVPLFIRVWTVTDGFQSQEELQTIWRS